MSQRLRQTIKDWQEKVGIKFELDEFDPELGEPEKDGLEEFD